MVSQALISITRIDKINIYKNSLIETILSQIKTRYRTRIYIFHSRQGVNLSFKNLDYLILHVIFMLRISSIIKRLLKYSSNLSLSQDFTMMLSVIELSIRSNQNIKYSKCMRQHHKCKINNSFSSNRSSRKFIFYKTVKYRLIKIVKCDLFSIPIANLWCKSLKEPTTKVKYKLLWKWYIPTCKIFKTIRQHNSIFHTDSFNSSL